MFWFKKIHAKNLKKECEHKHSDWYDDIRYGTIMTVSYHPQEHLYNQIDLSKIKTKPHDYDDNKHEIEFWRLKNH